MGSMLPLALALGATVATGGAAAPTLGAALGAEAGTIGATMLGSAAMGAGTSALGGIMQGKSGSDILRDSLISGAVGGGTAGIMGGLSGGAEAATVPTTDVATSSVAPNTGGLVNPQSPFSMSPTAPSLSESGLLNPQSTLSMSPTGAPTSLTPTLDNSMSSGIPKGGLTPTIDKYGSPPSSSFFDKAYTPTGIAKYAPGIAASLATSGMFGQPNINTPSSGGVPDALKFRFNADPNDPNTRYSPSVAPYYNSIAGINEGPRAKRLMNYANGGSVGTVEQMSRENATGGNQMFPQAGLSGLTGTNTYQNATNTPTPTSLMEPTDAITNPYTGAMKFATGGRTPTTPTQDTQQNTSLNLPTVKEYITAAATPAGLKQVSILAQNGDYNAQFALNHLQGSPVQGIDAASQMPAPVQAAQGGIMGYASGGASNLGSYSDGGRMLKGPGDGMSDSIPAKIGRHQPARLADGEFVVPADVVSHLGNGSTDAGAKHLYTMMDKVRKARTGRKAQGKQIKPEKYLPA
jgi:hypothetical protein